MLFIGSSETEKDKRLIFWYHILRRASDYNENKKIDPERSRRLVPIKASRRNWGSICAFNPPQILLDPCFTTLHFIGFVPVWLAVFILLRSGISIFAFIRNSTSLHFKSSTVQHFHLTSDLPSDQLHSHS